MKVSNLFLRLAVVWFVAGVVLGAIMGMSGNRTMVPVHVHVNLLGWVSMGLFAGFYRMWPEAATSRLASAHFWLYVPAHFVMMGALAAFYSGVAAAEPVLGISSLVVIAGVLCFAVLAWKHTGAAEVEIPPVGQKSATG